MLLPFYLGEVYGRSMDERKSKVEKSNVSARKGIGIGVLH